MRRPLSVANVAVMKHVVANWRDAGLEPRNTFLMSTRQHSMYDNIQHMFIVWDQPSHANQNLSVESPPKHGWVHLSGEDVMAVILLYMNPYFLIPLNYLLRNQMCFIYLLPGYIHRVLMNLYVGCLNYVIWRFDPTTTTTGCNTFWSVVVTVVLPGIITF